MNDLLMLQEFGESRTPPDAQPPISLRRRVLSGAPTARRRSPAADWAGLRLAWRLGPLGGAAAAILIAALLVGPTAIVGGSAPPPGTATGGAATADPVDGPGVLRLAAAYSAARPDLAARPEQYVFLETVTVVKGAQAAHYNDGRPSTNQQWLSVDGRTAGLSRSDGAGGDPYRRDDWACPASGRLPLDETKPNGPTVPCTPHPAFDPSLPADPGTMRQFLYRPLPAGQPATEYGPGASADDIAYDRLCTLLREDALHSPKVQAAAFAAAATMPGVTVRRGAVDAAGRPALAVTRTGADAAARTDLLFDPRTYAFLGHNIVVVRPDASSPRLAGLRPGDTQAQRAVLRVVIVDRVGEVP